MVSPKVTLSAGLFLTYFSAVMSITAVNLNTAANYAIVAQTGISTTGTTMINGNMAISPAAASAITGFSLTLGPGGTYATSPLVSGTNKVYAANYATPTPTTVAIAVNDTVNAYNDAAGRINPGFTNLGGGTITGPITLTPALYKWTTNVGVGGTVTLSGSATDVWIFQITGTLGFSGTANVVFTGGALAKNVFWQVTGQITCSAGSAPKGIFLAKTNVVFQSGATLTGRALAQTAVTMIATTITSP